jgi:hypothetical protein
MLRRERSLHRLLESLERETIVALNFYLLAWPQRAIRTYKEKRRSIEKVRRYSNVSARHTNARPGTYPRGASNHRLGVTAMRMKQKHGNFRGVTLWSFAILMLCALAPYAVGAAQINVMLNEWDAAVALGLTLIMAAGRNRK